MPKKISVRRQTANILKPSYVGAIIGRGGVANVYQSDSSPLLDEDEFFARTQLRLSFPARVAVKRLLIEDILLDEVRQLFQRGDLIFDGESLVLVGDSAQREKLQSALVRVNNDLDSLLRRAGAAYVVEQA